MQFNFLILLLFIFVIFTSLYIFSFLHQIGFVIPLFFLSKSGATILIGTNIMSKDNIKFKLKDFDIFIRKNLKNWNIGFSVSKENNLPNFVEKFCVICSAFFPLIIIVAIFSIVLSSQVHGIYKFLSFIFLILGFYDFILLFGNKFIFLNDDVSFQASRFNFLRNYQLNKLGYTSSLLDFHLFIDAFNIADRIKIKGLNIKDLKEKIITKAFEFSYFEETITLINLMSKSNPLSNIQYAFLGVSHFYLKNKLEKEDCFKKALELSPENPTVLIYLGFCLSEEGDFSLALDYLQKVNDSVRISAFYFSLLGLCKLELGKASEALNDLNKAISIDKNEPYAYRNLGIYELKLGHLYEAKNYFMQSKKMNKVVDRIDSLILEVDKKIAEIL